MAAAIHMTRDQKAECRSDSNMGTPSKVCIQMSAFSSHALHHEGSIVFKLALKTLYQQSKCEPVEDILDLDHTTFHFFSLKQKSGLG